MTTGFRTTIGSDVDYQDLVGEIYYDDRVVCVLTMEEGFDAMKVAIHAHPSGVWRFSWRELRAVMDQLEDRMSSLRRT